LLIWIKARSSTCNYSRLQPVETAVDTNKFLEILFCVLAAAMAAVGALNWLNRRHGGFVKGMGGAIFIGICWTAAILAIVLKVRS